MNSKQTDVMENYGREQFVDAFTHLTGQVNLNSMSIKLRGFHMFAWIPLYWPQIYTLPIRPEDIIIAGFPKSGTTWMQHMVYLIATENLQAANTIPIDVRVPFIDFPRTPHPSTFKEISERPSPRIIKTHLPPCFLPKDTPNGKLIYIYRNPKDVVTSFYHHYVEHQPKNVPFPKNFQQFVQDFIDGEVLFGPYPEHLKVYMNYKKAGNSILMLRYEDVKKDAHLAVRQIASYLGKRLSDEMVDEIYKATTVESMRCNSATNYSNKASDATKPSSNVIQSIRKGVVGDWKNHFDEPGLVEDFEKFISEKIPQELICPDI